MEKINLDKDMRVFYVTAHSFPEGILDAFEKLEALLPDKKDRTYFGLSYPEGTTMSYRAAVLESYAGEAEKYGCPTDTIKKGEYVSETVHQWKENMEEIHAAFDRLGQSDPRVTAPVIEWYKGNDVLCMLRLEEETR